MHLYVKHATLINNCYPEKEGETGSRSSELSYLTFYASSRPVKLTKVGAFLEKKVERDVAKSRKQHNIVSLEILRSLIQACQNNLNLFSKNIVKILTMVLDNKERDIDLIDLACDTFVLFCEYHDGTTLGVDAELTSEYEALMKRFASFTAYKSNNDIVRAQMIYTGHRGLQACAISPALHASNFKSQLAIIMPPVIMSLASAKEPVNELAKSSHVPDIKLSVIGQQLTHDTMGELFAAKTTSLLFERANGAAIRLALSPIIGFMDTKQRWWPPQFAVSVMELVLESLQPQYRYLLVSEILQQFDSSKVASVHGKQASLVSVLDTILNADIPLVGISVLEVLNSLFGHLIKALQSGQSFREQEPADDDEQAVLEYAVHQGLSHSIAGLASQTYYHNQLDDITGYLLGKLRVGTTLDTVEGLPILQYRQVTLKCLNLINAAVKELSSSAPVSVSDVSEEPSLTDPVTTSTLTSISLDTWVPALSLLIDRQQETRLDFALSLICFLDATTTAGDVHAEPFPKHTLVHHGDVTFINTLQQTIVQWVALEDFGVQDVQVLYDLLCAVTRRFGPDGTIKSIPLVFQLQLLVKEGNVTQTVRQRALAAVTVEYLGMVGQFYQTSRLVHYIDQVRSDRVQNLEYSSLFLDIHQGNPRSPAWTFDHIEAGNSQPVDVFLDRHVVVEILSKDAPFRDEEDVHGLDLESKLYAEWGSEAFANQDNKTFRIQVQGDDTKPKLATPWMSTDFKQTFDNKRQTIKVETLKEALATTAGDENDTTVDGLHVLTSSTIAKRTKDLRTDMAALLSSLDVTSSPDSHTASLVNPPYKS
ncbi:hypothetical protein DM01DRAFT_1384885 [Hesseltinella vesiculosa]|uniref:Protein EFR3 n=1 Tax=Hesseltinella vesiculosa TaxID=101127 RepID=A0A1X2GBX1_9FUNG|nr:hypothetical protein DM01DRAFT_1384885 [Hesseltinella vesiculosa]